MIKVDKLSNACVKVSIDNISSGWEQWIMLSSDRHFDSIKCDRALMKKHLDKAKERNAMIIDYGDFFDAMQGKFDPRRSYDEMRPEYKKDTYLDEIVKDAAEFMKPYAKNFLVIGRGNHDESVIKNNGTDIMDKLVRMMNTDSGAEINLGGYGGWVKFNFNSGKCFSKNIKYFHGGGGDSPVTKGMIDTARMGVFLPDADFVVIGHNHNALISPTSRERISTRGVISQDQCVFIRTPSYSIDYGDGTRGWHVERRGQPKPRGCAWIRFYLNNNEILAEHMLDTV